jgi:hypothetical protein
MRTSTCRPIWRPPARRGAADAQDPDLDLGADRDLRGRARRLRHGQAVVGVDRDAGASRVTRADDAGAGSAAAWHGFSRQPRSVAVGLAVILAIILSFVIPGPAVVLGFAVVLAFIVLGRAVPIGVAVVTLTGRGSVLAGEQRVAGQ